MRKMGLAAAVAVVLLAAACGGEPESDSEPEAAYGARSCSSYVGRMDDTERWDAAEELLLQAK
ncbi:hypothetical protein, partial [Streptomyces sp. NPDC056670]|uniref:hypothetical protein n=1 Tax=Streptomyces sp. NPDC056670 TaxID=3345904 RepID=UPI00368EEF75